MITKKFKLHIFFLIQDYIFPAKDTAASLGTIVFKQVRFQARAVGDEYFVVLTPTDATVF